MLEQGAVWPHHTCVLSLYQHRGFLGHVCALQMLVEGGEAAGMPKDLISKVGDCVSKGLEAIQMAHSKGLSFPAWPVGGGRFGSYVHGQHSCLMCEGAWPDGGRVAG